MPLVSITKLRVSAAGEVDGSGLDERSIRAAVLKRVAVATQTGSANLVLEELGLRHGVVRVDIAVVNGCLHGFEIKSAKDNLSRLSSQARVYSEVLDLATVVVVPKHLTNAQLIVPDWWEILVARRDLGAIRLERVRVGRPNPAPNQLALSKLLWRNEALQFLQELGKAQGFKHRPRAAIYAELAAVTSHSQLAERVRTRLFMRQDLPSGERQMSCDD